MLEEGSRFRAYKNSAAAPSLRYVVIDTIDYLESMPKDVKKKTKRTISRS